MSQKGSAFEREICKKLSEWWAGVGADVFWRTANSGGRATVRYRKGKSTKGQFGDICATDPIAQPFIDCFHLELKKGYSKATLSDLMDAGPKNRPTYAKWIDKMEETITKSGQKAWLLIHKRDGRQTMVYWKNRKLTSQYLDKSNITVTHIMTQYQGHPIWGVHLDRFLEFFKPEMVKEIF